MTCLKVSDESIYGKAVNAMLVIKAQDTLNTI